MTTHSPPRVLTCAYNNRRRNRIHPVTHPNIIINDTMNMQTSKPSKPIVSSKIKKTPADKLSINNGSLENIEDWTTLLSKGIQHEKKSIILQTEESSASLRAEICCDMKPSIFRDMSDFDDREEMMVLKRASPVYDSDDDEDYTSIPLKRQRTSGGTQTLQWGERLEETHDSFSSLGFSLE
mmetsp:Transcript_3074/g.6815  ORF Transcript_3074/g.6815 Transcript_3074/m.6815 type:complete len:181 (-) Transcript_3074:409-951(-)